MGVCPHFAHTFCGISRPPSGDRGGPLGTDRRRGACRVELHRDRFEVVVEQIGVGVEGHGSGFVTEHVLQRLNVRTGADREGGGGAAEIVRSVTDADRSA